MQDSPRERIGQSLLTDRVIYWTQGEREKNFGDYLTEYLLEYALIAPLIAASRYRLVGSALDSHLLAEDLRTLTDPAGIIACWQCGARSSAGLDDAVRARVMLLGVRGPLSRAAMDLPDDTPLGDPGLIVPLLYQPKLVPEGSGKTLCVPHFHERLSHDDLLERTGADDILSPKAADFMDLEAIFDSIASADFVLAGSLHAAIIAFAYRRPFAFLDLGFVDIPFKWQDFCALIGVEAAFVSTVEEGRAWFAAIAPGMNTIPLVPLVGSCPWAVRPSVMLAALMHDAGSGNDHAQLIRAARAMVQDGPQFAIHARASQSVSVASGSPLTEDANATAMLETAAAQSRDLAISLEAMAAAARFRFLDAQGLVSVLEFARGKAGAAMLAGNWAPPNDLGPVSDGPACRIILPSQTRWMDADHLVLEGLLFAPACAPFHGKRQMAIYANGTKIFDARLSNPETDEAFLTTMTLAPPRETRSRGGDLILDFTFDLFHSPLELGLRKDDRLVGIAPLRLWQEHAIP